MEPNALKAAISSGLLSFPVTDFDATGNRYFEDILTQLGNAIIPRARLNTVELEQDKPANFNERVGREHDDIFRAIERRDPEAARAAMRTHLSNSRERLVQAQRRIESMIN